MPTKYSVEDAPAQSSSKYSVEDSPDSTPTPATQINNPPAQATGSIRPLTDREYSETPLPVGSKDESLGENLGAIWHNIGVGAQQAGEAIEHPINTLGAMLSSINPFDQSTVNPAKQAYDALNTKPGEAAPEMIGQAIVMDPAVKGLSKVVLGPATKALMEKTAVAREGFRKGAQSVLGGGTRQVASEVAKVGDSAKLADDTHLSQTQDALHETQGRELQHQQAIQAANETASVANKALDDQHLKATQDALEQTREKEDLYQNELRKAKGESEDAYQKKLAEVNEKRSKADQTRKDELSDYFAKREKIRADQQSAIDSYRADMAKQSKIVPTQAKLQEASGELRGRVETAREKALGVGNKKYSGVNEALNGIEADPEVLPNALLDATEKIRGSDTQPAIIKDITNRVKKAQDVPTYEDLQGYYSELGKELSKGSLPGDIYQAYDTLHESIGNEMQRIADSQGKGAALLDARNYWRRMKQTFGKPITLSDNATAAIKGVNPEFLTDDAQANRVRMLGSFDPSIPKVVEHISNLQKGAEALPKPVPQRVLTGKLVDATTTTRPEVPSRPAAIPNPDQVPPREVQQPTRVEPPDRPTAVQPSIPKEPERVTPPDRPELQDVNTQQLRENLIRDKLNTWTNVSRFQMTRLVAGPIGTLIAAATGHPFAELAGAAYTAGEISPFVIQKLMDRPSFQSWITRPPVDELEALKKAPNADRIKIYDGLNKAVKAAQSKGIKVDPKLAALVGVSAVGPTTQKLRDLQNGQP